MPLSPRGRAWKWLGLLALTLVLGLAGCSPGLGTVSGTVSLKNGTKLKGGNVTFIPTKGQSISTKIGEDGKYTVENVAVGPVKITVETESLNPKHLTGMAAMKAKMQLPKDAPNAGSSNPAGQYVPIPDHEKYSDLTKTPLTYTVTKGSQTHNITLE